MKSVFIVIIYLIGAPFVGALIAGCDRIISARLQGRVGPPVLQPIYDVCKLLHKETIVVRRSQNFYITFFFLFVVFTGILFFLGKDLLIIIFSLTLANIFFVLGGYKGSSPYSFVGAERELIQMMAYEPMVIFVAVGMYLVTGSFFVSDIVSFDQSLVVYLPGVFIGLLYVLTIKLRKSPFDISTSHHAHQEIVKGITTEFSGKTLALIEISHWYETVFILGLVYLFFANNILLGIVVAGATYLLEVLIDNTFARLTWSWMLKYTWLVTLVFGVGNVLLLSLL